VSKSSSDKKAQTTKKKETSSANSDKNKKLAADTKKSDTGGSSKETKDKPSKSSETGTEKSQKETVSASDVHYGYFSSVRTPAYRSGWDAIYGQKETIKKDQVSVKTNKNIIKRARIKPPVTIELDIDSIPEDLRLALEDEIKILIKSKRLSYDKIKSRGSVRWNITCKIMP